jgi:hypothetical protein
MNNVCSVKDFGIEGASVSGFDDTINSAWMQNACGHIIIAHHTTTIMKVQLYMIEHRLRSRTAFRVCPRRSYLHLTLRNGRHTGLEAQAEEVQRRAPAKNQTKNRSGPRTRITNQTKNRPSRDCQPQDDQLIKPGARHDAGCQSDEGLEGDEVSRLTDAC